MSDTECNIAKDILSNRIEHLQRAFENRAEAQAALSSALRTLDEREAAETAAKIAMDQAFRELKTASAELQRALDRPSWGPPPNEDDVARAAQRLRQAEAASPGAEAAYHTAQSWRETSLTTVRIKREDLERAENHVTHMTDKKNDAEARVREKCNG